jgi:hypothetical protein
MLSDRLEKDLHRRSERGHAVDQKDVVLLEKAQTAVQQKRLGSCDASHG